MNLTPWVRNDDVRFSSWLNTKLTAYRFDGTPIDAEIEYLQDNNQLKFPENNTTNNKLSRQDQLAKLLKLSLLIKQPKIEEKSNSQISGNAFRFKDKSSSFIMKLPTKRKDYSNQTRLLLKLFDEYSLNKES